MGFASTSTAMSSQHAVPVSIPSPAPAPYSYQNLMGKRILFIGARHGEKSLAHMVTACDSGAERVYAAILPRHEPELRNLLLCNRHDYVDRIHLLSIPSLSDSYASHEIVAENIAAAATLAVTLANGADMEEFMIDACVTFQEDLLLLTSGLCAIWNLPGCDPKGVEITIDKFMFRTFLEENDLGRAYYSNVRELLYGDDQEMSLVHTGTKPAPTFPVVLKPTQGCGSDGVYLVSSMDELQEKLKGEYEGWMVEEYLQGPELGVELVMSHGRCIFASVMEATKTPPPLFQGTGRFYPTSLGRHRDWEVVNECVRAVTKLGLLNSVVDIDCKYVPNRGPVLIEINSRMGGHSVAFMHQQIFGVDLVLEHLRCGCGELREGVIPEDVADVQVGLATMFTPPPGKTWYTRIVLSDRSGIISPTLNPQTFLNDLQDSLPPHLRPMMKFAHLGRQPGYYVNSEVMPVILAFVLAVGRSRGEAFRMADHLREYASTYINQRILVGGKEGQDVIALPSVELVQLLAKFLRYYYHANTSRLCLLQNGVGDNVNATTVDRVTGYNNTINDVVVPVIYGR